MAKADKSGSKGGGDAKGDIKYLFAFLVPFLTGLIAYILWGKDDDMKYIAAEAMILGILFIIFFDFLWFLGVADELISLLIWLYGLYLGYEAWYLDDLIEPPVLGPLSHSVAKSLPNLQVM